VLPGHEWRKELMFSTERLANGEMDPYPEDYFLALRQVCPDARVLVTVRRQADWLFSNYHHLVQHLPPGRRSFVDFLQSIEGRIVAATAQFDRLIERLHAAFGRERVLVIPLEALETDVDGALRGLSDFLGCPYVPFEPTEKDLNYGVDRRRGADKSSIRMLMRAGPSAGYYQKFSRYVRYAMGRNDGDTVFSVPSKSVLMNQHGNLIGSIYAMNNVRLQRLTGLDLFGLGYPV
jgi:hypothetical protein